MHISPATITASIMGSGLVSVGSLVKILQWWVKRHPEKAFRRAAELKQDESELRIRQMVLDSAEEALRHEIEHSSRLQALIDGQAITIDKLSRENAQMEIMKTKLAEYEKKAAI